MSHLFGSFVTFKGIRGESTVETSCRACVMDGGFDDPLEGGTASTRRRITVIIKRMAWPFVDLPVVGDKITTDDTKTYAVVRVDPFYGREIVLTAREI